MTIITHTTPTARLPLSALGVAPQSPGPRLQMLYLDEPAMVDLGVTDIADCMDVLTEMFSLLDRGDYRMTGPNVNSHGAMLTFPETSDIPGMPLSGDDRRFMAMPAYVGGRFHMTGVKWYGSNIDNRRRGLPRSIHLLVLNDTESGAPLAVMSANLISAIRTGAVGGVGARALAREDATTVTIVGPGVMGRTALEAFIAARPGIDTVRVKGRSRGSVDAFVEYVRTRHPQISDVIVCDDYESAVAGADIVSYCTTGGVGADTFPPLRREWLKPGAFLSMPSYLAIDEGLERQDVRKVLDNRGLYEAWAEEIPAPHHDNLGIIGCRFMDLIEQGRMDPAELVDLGAIVNNPSLGRRSDDEIVLFSIGGMPVEDVAWGTELYRRAIEQGVGETLRLWDTPVLV
jgi:ornithine cyclodeaminase/alanine dehydrogenase-like protein (mu-crystallin family)